jgi:hypothetical protein
VAKAKRKILASTTVIESSGSHISARPFGVAQGRLWGTHCRAARKKPQILRCAQDDIGWGMTEGWVYAEKEVPQPQDLVLLGLMKLKPWRMSVSS